MDAENYAFTVLWSDPDEAFVAKVAEFPSLAAHGDTMDGALKEIRFVVQAVIADLQECNEPVPEPLGKRRYSGKMNLRIPPALHQRLTLEALANGISINQLINMKLASSF